MGGKGISLRKRMKKVQSEIKFWPDYKPGRVVQDKDYCLIYHNKELLMETHREELHMPEYAQVKRWVAQPEKAWYIGKWQQRACYAYEWTLPNEEVDSTDKIQPKIDKEEKSLGWVGYRDTRWNNDLDLYFVGIKVQQLLGWDRSTQFCGYCGKPYSRKEDERAKVCKACGSVQYPRISPAIIVGIQRGEQILLAHNANFREGLYSTIAGFVEQGESLEQAVRREIYEEVGIKVKNIKYFQSRPWISLDSLMVGFTAEYESGEIQVDGKEILDAGWYDKHNLPPLLPERITTAREIINAILGLEV